MEEIDSQNYKIFEILYKELNLYDNKRLMETHKTNPKDCNVITDSIFLDILEITLNEIFSNNNLEIKDILETYYNAQYPYVVQNIERCKGNKKKYLDSLKGKSKSLVYNLYLFYYYTTNGDPTISDIAELKLIYNTVYSGYTGNVTYIEQLENEWGIQNLRDNKIHQRFLGKRKIELAEYLNVQVHEIEDVLIDMMWINKQTGVSNDKFYKFIECEEGSFKILDKYKITVSPLHLYCTKKNLKKIIQDNFEMLCNGMLIWELSSMKQYSKEKLTLNMINRHVTMENPEAFLNKLASSIYFELLSKLYYDSIELYYKNFSFDKITGMNAIYNMQEDIKKLKEVISEKSEYTNKLNEENFSLKQKVNSQMKVEDRPFIEQITLFERQRAQANLENQSLKQKVSDQEKYIELLESKDVIEEEIIYRIEDISSKKLLFIGGMNEMVDRIKPIFPNSIFVSDEGIKVNSDVKAIVMFPKYMNHKLFYKYIAVARENNIKVVYCNNNNDKMVLGEIYRQIVLVK